MKIGIFENIMSYGGHELDFNRLLVEELKQLGHDLTFYVPDNYVFGMDYQVPCYRLKGHAVSYAHTTKITKLLLAVKREYNRFILYRELYELAKSGCFDALIVPTSTYRYLRAINKSVLRKSPVPIIFIQHGLNPQEKNKYAQEVQKLQPYPNIRPVVIALSAGILPANLSNLYNTLPPAFIPRDIEIINPAPINDRSLIIGFFGQFRREKKLENFLQIYCSKQYKRPVKLLIQGSTVQAEDAFEFERIIKKYSNTEHNIEFIHRGLFGKDWQEALTSIDALLMPYSAPRYRYHWGAMLFNAIGFQKPVIASDDINPEVFELFNIGKTFPSDDLNSLSQVLEDFINYFDHNQDTYHTNLAKAYEYYSPAKFAQNIVNIIQGS